MENSPILTEKQAGYKSSNKADVNFAAPTNTNVTYNLLFYTEQANAVLNTHFRGQ